MLFRFRLEGKTPTWATSISQKRRRTAHRLSKDEAIIILMIAVEEDIGSDIEQLYSSLWDADEMVVWSLNGDEAIPYTLGSIPHLCTQQTPIRIGIHHADGPFGNGFNHDDYVGSSASWLTAKRGSHKILAPIVSQDQRNRWLIALRTTLH